MCVCIYVCVYNNYNNCYYYKNVICRLEGLQGEK